jgi:hypothetical protein
VAGEINGRQEPKQMVRTRHSDIEIDLAADGVAREAVDELARGDDAVRLEAANRLRRATEALVTELVAAARSEGSTWADIGEVLGVSTQAAHQKYRWAVAEAIETQDDDSNHRTTG